MNTYSLVIIAADTDTYNLHIHYKFESTIPYETLLRHDDVFAVNIDNHMHHFVYGSKFVTYQEDSVLIVRELPKLITITE